MSSFDDRQKSYYLQGIERGVPRVTAGTEGVDFSAIRSALGIQGAVADFGSDNRALKADATCRALPYPGDAMRPGPDPTSRTGCGWWYTDSTSGAPSVGAYGTRRGPMNPNLDKQIGAGRWIWDPAEAYRLEGAKASSSVRSCQDLAFVKYPNIGWCPSTNSAVLTDGHGHPAFPRMAGGDCPGGNIIMNAGSCPPPSAPSSAPSPSSSQSISGLCTPDQNGALSPACLQTLTGMGGCSSSGTLANAFGHGQYAGTSDTFNAANRILQERGFTIHPGIVNDGRMSIDNMWSSLNGLKALTVAGASDPRSQGAALNLCYGTPFDPCALSASDKGPYDSVCITQTALGMGYKSSGKLLPGSKGMSYWNQFATWGDVVGNLIKWKQTADSGTDLKTQTEAIQNVYGVAVVPPRHGCNVVGMFMYRYFCPRWDPALFPALPSGAQTHFLGRYILKNGFGQNGSLAVTGSGSGSQGECQRMVGVFVPSVGGSYQFMISGQNFCRFQIDGTTIVTLSGSGSTAPVVSQTVPIIAGQSYTLVADVWNASPGDTWLFKVAVSVNGNAWAPISSTEIYMPVDRRDPMIDLTFSKQQQGLTGPTQIKDTAGVINNWLLSPAATIGTLNGRQCLVVSGSGANVNNRLSYIQGVRVRAIKSLTMMIQITTSKLSPTIVSFYNLPSTNIATPALTQGARPYTYAQRTDDVSLFVNEYKTVFPYGVPSDGYQQALAKSQMNMPMGQWFHLGYVWDDDGSGIATMYINGKAGNRVMLPAIDTSKIMENICIGCDSHSEGQAWSGGIAWFRAFDYVLTPDLLDRDMKSVG